MLSDASSSWWIGLAVAIASIGGYQVFQSYDKVATLQGMVTAKAELDHFGKGMPDPFKGFNNATADNFGLRSIPGLPKDRTNYCSQLRPGLVRSSYVLEMLDLSYPECIAASSPVAFKKAEVNGRPVGPAGCKRRWLPWQEGNTVVLRQSM